MIQLQMKEMCSAKLLASWVFFISHGKEGAFIGSSRNICQTTFLPWVLSTYCTWYVIKLGHHESLCAMATSSLYPPYGPLTSIP